jgi:hypothetical protein
VTRSVGCRGRGRSPARAGRRSDWDPLADRHCHRPWRRGGHRGTPWWQPRWVVCYRPLSRRDAWPRAACASAQFPGHVTSVDAEMYEAMKKAFLKILPKTSPGLTADEVRERVTAYLPEDLFPGGAKAGWWQRPFSSTWRRKVLFRERKRGHSVGARHDVAGRAFKRAKCPCHRGNDRCGGQSGWGIANSPQRQRGRPTCSRGRSSSLAPRAT